VEAAALKSICTKQGIKCVSGHWTGLCRKQVLFFTDQFSLLNPDGWEDHRIGFAYFHGYPYSGVEEFDQVYENLKKMHERISRIQVSHRAMRTIVLESGIEGGKVKLIPIGVDTKCFFPGSNTLKKRVRKKLGISDGRFVVGSFQKDGVGWGDGIIPKLIKGPDIFIETLARIKENIPELMVLLTGPARGYVKQGLSKAGIPFKHIVARRYSEIPMFYHALDAYLVTSRQEGGPKAILESMASGTPLVTTRVGQAMDIVKNGENGFMVDVEDVEGLVHGLELIYRMGEDQKRQVLARGWETAQANSLDRQGRLWVDFFDGVLE
jgi:glycosyltransferase involved in cell wall biosynthesis